MSLRIEDDLLIAVLDGRASADVEKEVELAIQSEPKVRLRMEELSGAVHWPLGSAPLVTPSVSESLHTAILRLEQDWDYVLAAHSPAPNSGSTKDGDNKPAEIPSVRIVREIGRGGMGVVYEGVDDALGRRVAIKQLHPQFDRDIQAKERLKREAQAIASLNHPHVIAIYGLQMVGGYPCLIQQFVDGESLQAILHRDGPIPFPRCTELAFQIAQGLAAAHTAGIIHRDLKPDNVLIEKGTLTARLGDFGLAKRAGDENMTMEGVVAGTPAYMAPEQTDGKGVDHRSDLFSLGALMYTMAAGKPPFEGDNPYLVMDAIRSRTQLPLASQSSGIPEWYSRLVDRLLAKDPSQRLQSIHEVVNAIRNQALPGPASPRGRFPIPIARAIVAAAAAIAVIGGVWLTNQSRDQGNAIASSSLPSKPIPTRPPISFASNGKSFEQLEDAIVSAIDGETVVIASDLETGRIDITGKSLQIEAAPDTRPTIRFQSLGNDSGNFFLRSDSHLSLKGLRLECKTTATMPWFEEGRFTAGIYTGQGKSLRVEDCEIYRTGGGICLGAGGDFEMRKTWLEGGDVGIGWFALDNTCRVEASLIHSKIGIGVVYPGLNMKPSRYADLVVKDSSLVTEDVLGLLLTRIPNQPVAVTFQQCVLDSKHAAALWLTPLMTLETSTSDDMVGCLVRSVRWQDNACVFATGMDYLISRRLRSPNRRNSAGVDSLRIWRDRCSQIHGMDDTQDQPSIERHIETEHPSTPSDPRRDRKSSVHHFVPELPEAWRDGKLLPGVYPDFTHHRATRPL
jgi:serine/threonine-protein kinase